MKTDVTLSADARIVEAGPARPGYLNGSRSWGTGTRAGFTLVELLVVIGIIGLLASLLLPALASAKDRGKDATCINNLRQIGIGMRLYQDDYDGRFPSAFVEQRDVVSGAVLRRYDIRYTLGGRLQRGSEHEAATYAPPELRPLSRYVNAAESFRCPKDKGVAVQECSCPNMESSKWEELGCSYHYNAGNLTALTEPATLLPQADPAVGLADKPEDWVNDTSRYILVFEPPARPWGCAGKPAVWVQWHRSQGRSEFTDPATAPAQFVSPILFVDSHVKIHNFSRSLLTDPYHPYEPTKDWIWYRPADHALASR